MGADAHHGPSPKGLLCNAGAGAAAGMLSIFLLSEKLNCKQKRKIEKDMFFVCFGQPCQINRGVWFGRKYLCFSHRLRSYEENECNQVLINLIWEFCMQELLQQHLYAL